jgi:hypothetical protein
VTAFWPVPCLSGSSEARRRIVPNQVNASTETIWLLIVYKKAKFDNLPTSFLVELKQGVEDAL